MKRFIKISTSVILLLLLFGSPQNKATAQEDGQVSYQTFYDELSPYGTWIDYPDYGYVWQPDLGTGFRPYSSNGHWVWNDDYEWMWVSDYSWGWAPFHYGRWFYDNDYGWLWIPGYEWSPAWVCWRSGGDYYGWAPLGPQFSVGVNLSFGRYSPPANYWCFVDRQYIASPRVYNYCYGVQRNAVFINNTTIINNYRRQRNVFVTGPGRREAERYTRAPIRSVAVRDMAKPGRTAFRNNEVDIYRPRVNRNNSHFAPGRVQQFSRGQRNDIADNRGNRIRQGNNMRGFEERRQQQERIMRGNNDANNRRQFEQRRQQEQMTRQRNEMENNRRQFQQRQQQDQMTRQRNEMENNRRQFQQRQQQDQMTRQRNEMENNRRQFEQRRQQDQMTRQRNEMENNRRQFEQRQQQQPQFQQRNTERPGGFRGQRQQQQQPQAQPQQRGGGNREDRGQGHGGWRHGGR